MLNVKTGVIGLMKPKWTSFASRRVNNYNLIKSRAWRQIPGQILISADFRQGIIWNDNSGHTSTQEIFSLTSNAFIAAREPRDQSYKTCGPNDKRQLALRYVEHAVMHV